MVAKIVSSSCLHIVRISFSKHPDTGTALLHLYAGALARKWLPSEAANPIQGIYIPIPSPFAALESFIEETVKNYNLELFRCLTHPEPLLNGTATSPQPNGDRPVVRASGSEGIRQALYVYKKQFPNVNAILLGTRRLDPHGGIPLAILIRSDNPSHSITSSRKTHTSKHDGSRLAPF